eukprot:scaffold78130_cov64-Phaeocystis_antarctica.AAC.3
MIILPPDDPVAWSACNLAPSPSSAPPTAALRADTSITLVRRTRLHPMIVQTANSPKTVKPSPDAQSTAAAVTSE